MRALVYEMTNPTTNEVVVVKTLDEARALEAKGYNKKVQLVPVHKPIFEKNDKGRTIAIRYPNLWED